MNIILIIALISLLGLILTGIFLRKKSSPYPSLISNLHKILAIAGIILMGIHIYKDYSFGNSLTAILLIVFAGILTVIALITGGLLVRKNDGDKKLITGHRVSSFLAILLLALFFTLN